MKTWLRITCVVVAVAACVAALPRAALAGSVQRETFGHMPDGREIEGYVLTNEKGATARVITYGAIVADLRIPDRAGRMASVLHPTTFSPDNLARHFPNSARVVGRVANRIAASRFSIDGREYRVTPNIPPHHIHGGPKGFDRVLWRATPATSSDGPAVRLTYVSVDGEEGYPGNLTVTLTYTLTEANCLRIEFEGTTDKPTLLNPTSHGFFNLGGGGDVRDHVLEVRADRYTVVDREKIPTGELADVTGTPFDFRQPTALGARVAGLATFANRYDHNLVVSRGPGDGLQFAARLVDPKSGRALEVWTNQPGLQLFTSKLDGDLPADGYGTVCLEAQNFPDAVNHSNFPSVVIRPGTVYRSTTEYRFINR